MNPLRLVRASAPLALVLVCLFACRAGGDAAPPPAGPAAASPPESAPTPSAAADRSAAAAPILPAFANAKQTYRKLIYGLGDDKPVVWLVVDGTDVLCDINRNGDLTEPGERQSYDGRTAHFESADISVWYHKNLVKSSFDGVVQGRLFPPGGATPEQAPTFHIAGPLAVMHERTRNRLGTKRDDVLLYVQIGTEYPGVEKTVVRYENIPRRVKPTLRLDFGDGEVEQLVLSSRC